MVKKFYSAVLILLMVLIPGAGEAFVPQAPHLVHMVLAKIKQPVGIEAFQTKKVLRYDDTSKSFDVIEEKLIYAFPDRLRSQIVSSDRTGFSVETGSGFIKVVQDQIVATEKSSTDLYTDILLYRDHESMLKRLVMAGIDTKNVSLQRYNNKICYVIGNLNAGLWIDKESLFPLKYVIRKNGWEVEFFYNRWQRVSRTWYPMSGSIFLDNQLFATIEVDLFVLKAKPASSLFDIAHIRAVYPESSIEETDPGASRENELDQRIENFKKLFE